MGGFYAMYAGDADGNGDIIGTDQTTWTIHNGEQGLRSNVYSGADFDLDTEVIGTDQTLWSGNNGMSTQIPN